MTDEPKHEKLSAKERARQARRAAYLRTKEWRASDPRHQAMKEAAKQHRHEAYQAAKTRKKDATVERRRQQKDKEAEDRAAKRAATDETLMKMVKPVQAGERP
jgi:hypothetical protein